ncbi:hypothetical protein EI94DRAFT_1752850 [Lactarius quietus]|nr:hypothetical protein EI94DRAFT_1752850 [Lactarius quietus]
MSNESSFLHSPRTLYHYPVENVELPSSTIGDGIPWPIGDQSDANNAGAYHGPNDIDHGHWTQYRDNLWYDLEGPPPPAADLEGRDVYHRNLNVSCPHLENSQEMIAAPGPSNVENNLPPAGNIPNDGAGDRPPPMSDVVHPSSRNIPESVPSITQAMEGLKRLANCYLNDPCSQVDDLRMGLSPSGRRLRVMIVLDMDI